MKKQKHQSKSGSKRSGSTKKRQPSARIAIGVKHFEANGDVRIDLNETGRELLNAQLAAFEAKFGRPPGPKDPIFFDPDEDEPTEISDEKDAKQRRELAKIMLEQGIRPQIVHAFERTKGLMPIAGNEAALAKEDLREWNKAIEHYFKAKEMADKATEQGVHPAIVYAISKTGIWAPKNLKIVGDGVEGSGDDIAFAEYMNEYARLHPDTP